MDTQEMLKRFDKIVDSVYLLTKEFDKNLENNKKINNVWVYLIEISIFCIHLDGLMLQKNVRKQVLNNSDTLNRINALEKSWEKIDLNKDLNLKEENNNILSETDKSLNNLSDAQIKIIESTFTQKEEILSAISKIKTHLIEVKEVVLRKLMLEE